MNDAKINLIVNSVNIRQKPNGSYEARITIDGNRKSFCRKTKAQVKQEIREYLHKVENGYKEPKKILLNDYMEYWLKGDSMDAVQILKKQENTYTIDDAMQVLFSKLDEALDDFENGRVISEEEMWAELDTI